MNYTLKYKNFALTLISVRQLGFKLVLFYKGD